MLPGMAGASGLLDCMDLSEDALEDLGHAGMNFSGIAPGDEIRTIA